MTETQARANRDGHPCPPWCDRDHLDGGPGHSGKSAGVEVAGGKVRGLPDSLRAYPWQSPGHAPEVAVIGQIYGVECKKDPALWVSLADAEHLACVIDMLTGATKAQHRALAAAIRKAAAQITDAETAEAGQ